MLICNNVTTNYDSYFSCYRLRYLYNLCLLH
nr:MAG TPA: hypothetical protein [Caudoviricetes sp.]